MDAHLSEEALWAAGLSARLRLVQSSFADDAPTVRQGYITEEIDRALKTVSPTKRKLYLDSLAQKFPAWEGTRSAATADSKQRVAPQTPEELLSLLIKSASGLSAEAKADFARKLEAAGLALPRAQQPDAFVELPPDLQKRLGLAAGKPMSVERAVKTLALTSELALTLDQLAWALWKQLAPKSNVRKEADFAKLAGQYLAGDGEVSSAMVGQPLERTRRLIAGLLGAVAKAGSTYAKKHTARFAPEVIEDWAKMEKKWSESLELVCWRKYVEHAKEHASEAAIENEIQEAIAKSAENLMLGRSAG